MREDRIIANQQRILANQEQIKQSQEKLDLLLATQETILSKQEAIRRLETQLSQMLSEQDRQVEDPEPLGEMIGASPAFQHAIKGALQVAETDTTVLLRGETGTGKELLAHAIHRHSPRRRRPFIIVNCAALPATLVESELFGYEKGAFTGAQQRKAGRFELADGGTIFLDEIGEVPLETQGRFLRVLQTGVIERLGGTQSIRVKVRIIAATNQPLEQLVNERRFRADLFYRLNVFPITLPPLRDRSEDIALLVQYFARKFASRFKRPIRAVSEASLTALSNYHFPGNIRELEHIVERAVLASDGDTLRLELPEVYIEPVVPINAQLPAHLNGLHNQHPHQQRFVTLFEQERDYIERVLRHTRGRIAGARGAAAILGLPSSTLRSRIKKLGISFRNEEI
ncbi:MAG: sigma 54-interacting transcriptional regulator [Acidobacteria bacterium]|nr:sigma 54-interacting transcriptional regulator [Acidobacteriota bacterium]MCW5969916.1 sigma 54-interacting transcriptional regulator [Blastocatellales bacterium]